MLPKVGSRAVSLCDLFSLIAVGAVNDHREQAVAVSGQEFGGGPRVGGSRGGRRYELETPSPVKPNLKTQLLVFETRELETQRGEKVGGIVESLLRDREDDMVAVAAEAASCRNPMLLETGFSILETLFSLGYIRRVALETIRFSVGQVAIVTGCRTGRRKRASRRCWPKPVPRRRDSPDRRMRSSRRSPDIEAAGGKGLALTAGRVAARRQRAGRQDCRVDQFGRVDILVQTTSAHVAYGPMLDMTDDQLRLAFDYCVTSAFIMTNSRFPTCSTWAEVRL